MDCPLLSTAFADFGPSAFACAAEASRIATVHGRRSSQLRSEVRRLCPRKPGVYGMVYANGELIYVGKAKSLRARLLSYFRPKSRDRRSTRILRHTRTIVWESATSEFAALLRELELIRRWRPRANVQGQPLRRRLAYVCIGRTPAPYVFLSRRPPASIVVRFGPVSTGPRAQEAVRRLNDLFRLRDCPQPQEMIFAEDAELFPGPRTAGCLRHEIGTCLGPCAALCSRSDYDGRVRAATAFLAGGDDKSLAKIEAEMTAAA